MFKRYLYRTSFIDNLTYTSKDGNVSNILDRFDGFGNRLTMVLKSVNQANEWRFDANGNLTSDANIGMPTSFPNPT